MGVGGGERITGSFVDIGAICDDDDDGVRINERISCARRSRRIGNACLMGERAMDKRVKERR